MPNSASLTLCFFPNSLTFPRHSELQFISLDKFSFFGRQAIKRTYQVINLINDGFRFTYLVFLERINSIA